MFDVFLIQACYIVIFRYAFGMDIPSWAVWAALFGTGAVQRLVDYWSMFKGIGLSREVEPTVLHAPIIQAASWVIFWGVTIGSRLVWPDTPILTLREILANNPTFGFMGFYFWGMISSIFFDLVAFESRLFYPFSNRHFGLDLVNRLDSKVLGWVLSVVIVGIWGFLLSILILDVFWSNLFF